MNEMIKRVAKGLCRLHWNDEKKWKAYTNDARTAIANMREPTDQQRNNYYDIRFKLHTFDDATWEATIDSALKDD